MDWIIVDTALMERVTGLSPKKCQRDMRAMKDSLGKMKHQFITKREYANWSGIPLEVIEEVARRK